MTIDDGKDKRRCLGHASLWRRALGIHNDSLVTTVA